jgi:hypothetical protein
VALLYIDDLELAPGRGSNANIFRLEVAMDDVLQRVIRVHTQDSAQALEAIRTRPDDLPEWPESKCVPAGA